MPDYQKMYYALCAAASHALDILPATALKLLDVYLRSLGE